MKIRSQVGMVLNLDKCIGCHTCSVTCKNVWTGREGMEYAWFNNVETKMLTPHWMYAWFLPVAVKQQMAMILGGICGVLTLIGGAGLLVRRLTNPRIRVTSSGADILILAILLIQCILGLTTIPFSAQHPDGSEMMKLVGWAQSIVTFQGGASTHLDGVAFIFRVHLVLGMTIFLLFPFTRLVHVWSAPFEYFTRRYQIVRSRR